MRLDPIKQAWPRLLYGRSIPDRDTVLSLCYPQVRVDSRQKCGKRRCVGTNALFTKSNHNQYVQLLCPRGIVYESSWSIH